MKTTIDLTQFDFNSRIYNQISDCPDTGFVRVLVYTGDNYQERIIKYLSFDKYLKIAFKVLIAVYKLDQRKEGQS